MKKINSYLFLSIPFLLLAGCSGKKKGRISNIPGKIVTINIDEVPIKPFDISIIADTISYLPLNTQKNYLIGAIDKLKIWGNKIFILDKNLSRSLFVYDFKGNPLFKLECGLGGPGEFTTIDDFTINESSGDIYVLSTHARAIFIYNNSGAFLKETRMPVFTDNIEIWGNKMYCYRSNSLEKSDKLNNGSFYATNFTDNKVTNVYLQVTGDNNYLTHAVIDFSLYKTSEGICLGENMSDTLYFLNKYNRWTKYYLNFGSARISDNIKNIADPDKYLDLLDKGKYAYFTGAFSRSDAFLTFSFIKNRQLCYYFKNLRTAEQYAYNSIINSYNNGPVNIFIYVTDSLIISVLPPDMLISAAQYKLNTKATGYADVYSQLKDIDLKNANPVLCLIKPKH